MVGRPSASRAQPAGIWPLSWAARRILPRAATEVAMSSTSGSVPPGAARAKGLVPRKGSLLPQIGMALEALVMTMAAMPSATACSR